MDISIIVVSWNVRDLLRRCLQSIYEAAGPLSLQVVVVDNDSEDGSAAMVQTEFPAATLIEMGGNVGFAQANNRALKEAQGRYIFLLNPDCELSATALEQLTKYLDTHPDVSLVAPQLINADGSFQQGSIRTRPKLLLLSIILLKLQPLLRNTPMFKRYYREDFNPTQEQAVEQIMGAAMFFRKSALDEVGGFDENFFIWFEEVDLCARLLQAGKQIRYYPAATVIHHGGQSFKQVSLLRKQMRYNRAVLYFVGKHYGALAALVIMFLIPINIFLVSIYSIVYGNARK